MPRAHRVITEREHEILILIGEGLTDDEIAARLGIGRRTVGSHVSVILIKLDCHSRAQAVAVAIRAGVLN